MSQQADWSILFSKILNSNTSGNTVTYIPTTNIPTSTGQFSATIAGGTYYATKQSTGYSQTYTGNSNVAMRTKEWIGSASTMTDSVYGGSGNDFLFGNGYATLSGGAGNDVLMVGTGCATKIPSASGGDGDDLIILGAYISGASSSSNFLASWKSTLDNTTTPMSYLVREAAQTGRSGYAYSGSGGNGNDTLIGSESADNLNGSAGNDLLYGMGGNDILHGGEGDDIAYGGAGNDSLYATGGIDYMYGEEGDDRYGCSAGSTAYNTAHIIENSGEGIDTLALSTTLGNVTFFVGTGTSANDLIVDTGNGNIVYLVDWMDNHAVELLTLNNGSPYDLVASLDGINITTAGVPASDIDMIQVA